MGDADRERLRKEFDREVLDRVRTFLGNRSIRVPQGAHWFVDRDNKALTLCVEVDAEHLCRNFQETIAASPSFLICLAYWLERLSGTRVRCRVLIAGAVPGPGRRLQHWRRSMFVLNEMKLVLGDRLSVEAPACASGLCWDAPDELWPPQPMLNHPLGKRDRESGTRPEHVLEQFLYRTEDAWRDFPAAVDRRGRQLPVGLFDGAISRPTHWSPGGASQIDLWGISRNNDVLHLFELKTAANVPLGILPEAFYYARLLHYVRVGTPAGRLIAGGDPIMDLLRDRSGKLRRIQMWLSAPKIHPLLDPNSPRAPGSTPLEWLNAAMANERVQLGVAPFEWDAESSTFRWKRGEFWGGNGP